MLDIKKIVLTFVEKVILRKISMVKKIYRYKTLIKYTLFLFNDF